MGQNKDKFQRSLTNSLNSEQFESVTVEKKVDLLSEMTRRAAAKSVPTLTCKLKGPKRRVSPKVRELLKLCKTTHKNWKYKQDDSNVDILFAERKLVKKTLRTPIRYEKSQEKDNIISELMSNLSTKLFYEIVRRNRSDSSSSIGIQYIKHDGKELYDPSEQVVAFTEFYEDFAMPKAEPHFHQEYSAETSAKYEHIKILCNETRTATEVSFTENDIQKAVSRLNNGKSADEFGIHAEHFKLADNIVLPFLITLLRNGEIPKSFKSGILTPVHKKDKDPTSLDNYRGITVSATIGKIFEYA